MPADRFGLFERSRSIERQGTQMTAMRRAVEPAAKTRFAVESGRTVLAIQLQLGANRTKDIDIRSLKVQIKESRRSQRC
jgi:hypothetical protein